MNIINNINGTIYFLDSFKDGLQEAFRIKQLSDNEFIIEKPFLIEKTKKSFWKTTTTKKVEWKEVDTKGRKLYLSRVNYYFNNLSQFKIYETKQKAIKWIEEYEKYPIIL